MIPIIREFTEAHALIEGGKVGTVCDNVLVCRVLYAQWLHTHCHQDNMHAGAPVYACNVTDIDSYCCYDNCKCDKPFEVFSFPGSPSAVSTKTIILEKFTPTPSASTSKASTSSATFPASASTSPTGSSSGAQSLNSNEGSHNYLALGIGLGLGLGLGFPLIFLAGFCIWRRKQANNYSTKHAPKSLDFNNEGFYPLQPKHEYAHEAPRTPPE